VPTGSLLAGSGGALYGTTVAGGAAGLGTVYMIAPPSGGGWSESVLYGFSGGDGASPQASLLADASGALYGTTASGGAGPCFGGCGTVFKLTPPVAAGAPWTESVLYGFSGGGDGRAPFAPLVADANGALYGTTVQGGVTAGGGAGFGTVFRLAPPAIAGGAWTLSTLYTFTGGNDAGAPFGGVVLTHGGGLLGTAYNSSLFGGGNRFGVVYRLTPPAVPGGAWTAALVYGFRGAAGSDGAGPYAGLTAATAAGTYYGTTQSGGVNGWGTVFQITP
jgi:uncharacterized repeat protein (TIGR03803 family)